MREIRLICKKELSRVLTDRKMLFSIFLLPAIIMVVVMNVMTSFSENLENDVKSHAPTAACRSNPTRSLLHSSQPKSREWASD